MTSTADIVSPQRTSDAGLLSPDSDSGGEAPVICHVIHAMGVGGAEVLVDQLVRSFDGPYRTMVAVLDDVGELGRQLRRDGFDVIELQRSPGIDVRCAMRLRRLVQENHVRLIHAHQYTPFFQAMLSRRIFGNVPILFTEHGRHFPDIPSMKRSVVNRLLLRSCDRLVGVGESVRNALIRNEGLPADRVEVIFNGVDLSQFDAPAPDARERIRAELGIGETDFTAVMVARLNPLKDHQTAVRCIAELRRTVPNAKLVIVGDGECRADVEATVRDAGLPEHVLLTGTRSDIPDVLAASDAFLLTSISEGIPLTIIESMAAGIPVVATTVGGIPEMIEDGVSGFLCPVGDAAALAESLERLSRDPELKQRMISEARHRARRQFSMESMMNSYGRAYSEMIGVSTAGGHR